MARKFHSVVRLSNRTAIEFDVFASSKIEANKSIVSHFNNGKIQSIKTY